MDTSPHWSDRPFGEALAELLRRRQRRPWRPSLQLFAEEVGINYWTLRSAVTGRTRPSREMMRTVAEHLGVPATSFREYRVFVLTAAMEDPDILARLFGMLTPEEILSFSNPPTHEASTRSPLAW